MNVSRLELDFVAPRHTPARVLAWMALAAASALVAWRVDVVADAQETQALLSARQQALSLRLDGPRAAPARRADPATQQRLVRADAVLQRLALPWESLFGAIEAADSRRLALLSLEPNVKEGSVRVTGEAPSITELLAYVDRLGLQPSLAQVHLVSYESVQREGATVVAFNLQARWTPP